MANQTLVVLFNLKPGASVADYERWALTTDLPTVKALASVDGFAVYRTKQLLGSDGTPPYAYVEVIDVNDMDRFGGDVASATMTRVAAEFQAFADPVFMLTERLG